MESSEMESFEEGRDIIEAQRLADVLHNQGKL